MNLLMVCLFDFRFPIADLPTVRQVSDLYKYPKIRNRKSKISTLLPAYLQVFYKNHSGQGADHECRVQLFSRSVLQ